MTVTDANRSLTDTAAWYAGLAAAAAASVAARAEIHSAVELLLAALALLPGHDASAVAPDATACLMARAFDFATTRTA